MVFRENETDRFPFDNKGKHIWYAIITSDPMEHLSFTSSNSGKQDLIEKIKQLNTNGKNHIILGVWQGQWKTDIFVLDGKLCIKKIKKQGEA